MEPSVFNREILIALQLGVLGGSARLLFDNEKLLLYVILRRILISIFVALMVSLWVMEVSHKLDDIKHYSLIGFAAFFAEDVIAGAKRVFNKFRNGK